MLCPRVPSKSVMLFGSRRAKELEDSIKTSNDLALQLERKRKLSASAMMSTCRLAMAQPDGLGTSSFSSESATHERRSAARVHISTSLTSLRITKARPKSGSPWRATAAVWRPPKRRLGPGVAICRGRKPASVLPSAGLTCRSRRVIRCTPCPGLWHVVDLRDGNGDRLHSGFGRYSCCGRARRRVVDACLPERRR